MLGIVFLSAIVIAFVIYQTKVILDVEKESDHERIIELLEKIDDEKTISKEIELEKVWHDKKERKTNDTILQIRLELLNIEGDLKEIIPQLLN